MSTNSSICNSSINSIKRKQDDFLIENESIENNKRIKIVESTDKIINSETLFVLGKNVNEIFIANNINTKSIYSQFPNLFKYEADNEDRLWLFENSIIERKNFKCFIYLQSEITDLFVQFELN